MWHIIKSEYVIVLAELSCRDFITVGPGAAPPPTLMGKTISLHSCSASTCLLFYTPTSEFCSCFLYRLVRIACDALWVIHNSTISQCDCDVVYM